MCRRLPPAEDGGLVACSGVRNETNSLLGFPGPEQEFGCTSRCSRKGVGYSGGERCGLVWGITRLFWLQEVKDRSREPGVTRLHEASQKDRGSDPGWGAGCGDRRPLCSQGGS